MIKALRFTGSQCHKPCNHSCYNSLYICTSSKEENILIHTGRRIIITNHTHSVDYHLSHTTSGNRIEWSLEDHQINTQQLIHTFLPAIRCTCMMLHNTLTRFLPAIRLDHLPSAQYLSNSQRNPQRPRLPWCCRTAPIFIELIIFQVLTGRSMWLGQLMGTVLHYPR